MLLEIRGGSKNGNSTKVDQVVMLSFAVDLSGASELSRLASQALSNYIDPANSSKASVALQKKG